MNTSVIPAEAVEAAAKAAAKDEDASNWHEESEYYRNGWRNRMQVALEAAAPYMRAPAWDDGEQAGAKNHAAEEYPELPIIHNPYRPAL